MSDIFISYSRKDIAYARLLHKALNENDFETWIDWQDIPPSTEWLQEVFTAIEEANTFIFIISASSVLSDVCKKEIEHANKNNKRIIPIVIDDVNPSKVHPALAAINWIFSRGKDELQPSINSLIEAIQTDYDWVKAHTRLQVRALEWERAEKDKSFLLQGTDLHQAENWLAESVDKEPEPTLQQTRYIQSSRQGAVRRQRNLLLSVGAALVVTIILGVFAVINGQRATQNANSLATQVVIAEEQEAIAVEQKEIAIENAHLARIRELTLVSQQDDIRSDIAILLGIESYNSIENYQTRSNLFRLSQLYPKIKKIIVHESADRISFSPDGQFLVSISLDGDPVIWETANGQPSNTTFTIDDLGEPVRMKFSPDGTTVAVSYDAENIILWDIPKGRIYDELGKHPGGIECFTFSPDGRYLASANGNEGTVIVWDIARKQQIGETLHDYYSEGHCIFDFSPDGKTLAYTSGTSLQPGSIDSNIAVWDIVNWQSIKEPLQGFGHMIYDISFSPDGGIFAAVGVGNYLKVWNTDNWQVISEERMGHDGGISSLSFNPDGKSFATSGTDSNILVWDTESLQAIGEPFSAHLGGIQNIAYSPDGKTLASCSMEGTIILWDVEGEETPKGDIRWENAQWWGMQNIEFSPDRKLLASGNADGSIMLWDIVNGQSSGDPLLGHKESVVSVAFSGNGKNLASVSNDGKIILWDVVSKRPLLDLQIATDSSGQGLLVSLNPDGTILAAATHGPGNYISLWDTATGQLIEERLIENENNLINTLAFSLDGKVLAVGTESGIPLFINMATGNSTEGYGEGIIHTGWISSLAFSPDGGVLAAGTDGSVINLWDAASHKSIGKPLHVHNTPVFGIDFNHDGTMFASTSSDGQIILWDTNTMQPLGESLKEEYKDREFAHIIAFSQDGKTLIASHKDGFVYSWDTDIDSWQNQLCEKVSRNFTQEEWSFYFQDEPYRKTCEQWPEGD